MDARRRAQMLNMCFEGHMLSLCFSDGLCSMSPLTAYLLFFLEYPKLFRFQESAPGPIPMRLTTHRCYVMSPSHMKCDGGKVTLNPFYSYVVILPTRFPYYLGNSLPCFLSIVTTAG